MELGFVYFVFLPSLVTTLWAGRAVHRYGTRPTLWGSLVLAGGGLPMGQVIGRSTADGSAPANNPVHMRHLIGTIMHTLFDVGELRLRPDATGAVAKLITESEPIKGLSA